MAFPSSSHPRLTLCLNLRRILRLILRFRLRLRPRSSLRLTLRLPSALAAASFPLSPFTSPLSPLSLFLQAQPSFFNPRSSFRRQSFPLRQVDSTRFGTHLAVRTYLPAGRKPRPLPRPQQCPMSLVVGSAT